MKIFTNLLVTVLACGFAVSTLVQGGADAHGDQSNTESNWSELIASMDKMHMAAAFVAGHPSGIQLTEIAKLIDSGELTLTIDRILPLSEVRRAHQLSQTAHARGKIVLRVKNGEGTLERKQ